VAPKPASAAHGKKRCRMHGGAPGAGAPATNQNAHKHGLFSRDAVEERRRIQAVLGEAQTDSACSGGTTYLVLLSFIVVIRIP
jgi:hypothetical protein